MPTTYTADGRGFRAVTTPDGLPVGPVGPADYAAPRPVASLFRPGRSGPNPDAGVPDLLRYA